MKKALKRIAIVLLVIAILISALFIYDFVAYPKEDEIRAYIKNLFGVTFSDEWSYLYMFHGPAGFVDRDKDEVYYVFKAPTEDTTLPFSSEKNEDLETTIEKYSANLFQKNGKPYTPKYQYDSEKPYEWYRKDATDTFMDRPYSLFMIVLRQDNLAYIFIDPFVTNGKYDYNSGGRNTPAAFYLPFYP